MSKSGFRCTLTSIQQQGMVDTNNTSTENSKHNQCAAICLSIGAQAESEQAMTRPITPALAAIPPHSAISAHHHHVTH
jgi:hypothetical protein